MSGYLKKYVGTYRVLADYNLDTNDYPREANGAIDKSFDDYYILGRKHLQVRHGCGKTLSCFMDIKGTGLNVIRAIYKDAFNKEPSKNIDHTIRDLEASKIIYGTEVLDGDVIFRFDDEYLKSFAKIFKLKTSGSKVQPLSKKNLPKGKYKIPQEDLDKYKLAIANMTGFDIKNKNNIFQKKLLKKNKNWVADQKFKGIKFKEYVHSVGLFDEYLKDMVK